MNDQDRLMLFVGCVTGVTEKESCVYYGWGTCKSEDEAKEKIVAEFNNNYVAEICTVNVTWVPTAEVMKALGFVVNR